MSRYMGTVESGVLAESKNGNPQMALKIRLTQEQGDDGNLYDMQNPLQVNVYFAMSDRAMEYTEAKLKKLGFNGDFENPAFSQDAQVWIAKQEEYEGRMVTKYDLADWGTAKQAPVATAKLLTMKWRQKFAGAATPKPAVAVPKPLPSPKSAPSRDSIWAAYCAQTGNAPDMTAWHEAVANQGDAVNRTEAKFTAADWAAVGQSLAKQPA